MATAASLPPRPFDIVGNLPLDIIADVAKYVPRLTDLISFQQVSRAWHYAFTSPVVYSKLCHPLDDDSQTSHVPADEDAYQRFLRKCFDEHAIMTLNVSDRRVCHLDAGVTNQISCTAFSDSFLVFYLQADRRFLVWDFSLDTMEPRSLDFGTQDVTEMSISDKGNYLSWMESDKDAIFVFDLKAAYWASDPSCASSSPSPGRKIMVFPFPPQSRPAVLNPFSCDGEHLVARFSIASGSPHKFFMVWNLRTRELVSKFQYTVTGLWDTSAIFAEKKIYLFSLPPFASDYPRRTNLMFPGYSKTYDLQGNVIASIGILPGTEFRYDRLFQPVCGNGKITYAIARQGVLHRGHCLSLVSVDERTGIESLSKFYPECSSNKSKTDLRASLDTDDYYPFQECITQKNVQCMYLFHGIVSAHGPAGEVEIWDTTCNRSRRIPMPKTHAVYGNESFFAKSVNKDLYIHRYMEWDEYRSIKV